MLPRTLIFSMMSFLIAGKQFSEINRASCQTGKGIADFLDLNVDDQSLLSVPSSVAMAYINVTSPYKPISLVLVEPAGVAIVVVLAIFSKSLF